MPVYLLPVWLLTATLLLGCSGLLFGPRANALAATALFAVTT
jgi:hypothetical protein